MIKNNNNRCCSCSKLFINNLVLDCQHSICANCIDQRLKQEEKHESLEDEIEIQCSTCSYVTQISMALAYKIVRPNRQQVKNRSNNNMVCMDCLNGCFSIEDFLSGQHSSHQTLTIERAYLKIKDILFYEQKHLEQASNQYILQSEKLIHCKSMLNDIFNANIIKIKMAFQSLKDQIIKRQIQVLDFYQERIYQMFCSIDQQISQSKRKVQLCKKHIQQINDVCGSMPENSINNRKQFNVVNYFIQNHRKIQDLTVKDSQNSISIWVKQLDQNRKIVNLEQQRQIQRLIRTMEVFRSFDDSSTTISATSLSKEYFETKRKEVLSSTPQDDSFLMRCVSSGQINMKRNNKKYLFGSNRKAQTKHKLKMFYPL